MQLLIFPLLAFAPGIFWLWFFLRKDIYRPEPKRLLALTFFLGMVSTIPAGLIEAPFLDESVLSGSGSLASVAMGMLFVVGPAEELAKFLAVRLVPYRSLYFDEPGDGLVYGTAASLGFASLENLFYILTFGPTVMILRAPLSTLAHVVFGSFWGYALGRQVQQGSGGFRLVLAGVIAGAIVHGLFNVALFTYPLAAVILVVLGTWWTLRRFDWAQRVSPFRYRRNYPKVACHNCSQRINIISRYCRFCGSSSESPHSVLFCSYCGNQNRPDAAYCTGCGDQLMK